MSRFWMKRPTARRSRHANRCRCRPHVEPLEERVVPATLDVTNGVLTYTAAAGENNNLTIEGVQGVETVNGTQRTVTVFQLSDSGTSITLTANAIANGWTNSGPSTVDGADEPPDGSFQGLTLNVDLVDGTDSLQVPVLQNFTGFADALNVVRSGGGSNSMTLATDNSKLALPVTVTGAGVTALQLQNASGVGWTISPTSIIGGDLAVPVTFSGLSALTFVGSGSGSNSFTVTGVSAPTTLLTAGPDTITVQNGLAPLTVTGGGEDVVTVVSLGGSTDTLAVAATAGPLTIAGNGGTDVVTLGDGTNGVQPITGAVSISNPAGFVNLSVNDSGDTTGRSATITTNSITGLAPAAINYKETDLGSLTVSGSAGGGTITVLGTSAPTTLNVIGGTTVNVQGTAQPLAVNSAGSDTVDVGGGVGRLESVLNQVTVNGSGTTALIVDDSNENTHQNVAVSSSWITGLGAASVNYLSVGGVVLDGGIGADTLTIQGTASGTAFTYTGRATDAVTVGNGGSVQGIHGTVTLTPLVGAQESVTIDDSTDPAAQGSVKLSASTLTGLAPAGIVFAGNPLVAPVALTILGSAGGDVFDVTDVSVPTTLDGGNGNDTLTVAATSAPLTFNGQAGADAVTLGGVAGSGAQLLQGAITVRCPAGSCQLTVDDSQETAAQDVTVTDSALTDLAPVTIAFQDDELSGLNLALDEADNTLTVADTADAVGRTVTVTGGAIDGLVGPHLGYQGRLTDLTIAGGSGGNTFQVQGTPAPTTLSAGNGSDTITVVATANALTLDGQAGVNSIILGNGTGLAGLAGPITVQSSSPSASTTLTVDDQGDNTSENITLTNSTITGLPLAGLTYTGLAELTVQLGSGIDRLDVSGYVGNASLAGGGGTDTVTATANANFMLTDSILTVSGSGGNASIALAGISDAVLTGGAGDNVLNALGFSGLATLSGGGGIDSLAGGSGLTTVAETADDNFTLTGGMLTGVGTMAITDLLVNVNSANVSVPTGTRINHTLNAATFRGSVTLTGGAGNDTLTGGLGTNVLSGGTGTNKLIGGKGATNIIAEAQDASFALTRTKLVVTKAVVLLTDSLTGGAFTLARLTDTNTTGVARSFTTTGFVGGVTLTGGAGNDTFALGAGTDSINGGGGSNTLVESGAANFTLTNSSLTSSGAFHDTLQNVPNVRLTITSGSHVINAALFTGNATLQGGGGNDTLIGGAGNDSLSGGGGNNVLLGGGGNDKLVAGGTGRNLLIGGSGGDTLIGGTGSDLLVAGTTTFSDASGGSVNFAALNAIMAEWTSTDSYTTRIARLNGSQAGGKNGTTHLDSSTVTTDSATAKDTLTGGLSQDWFITAANDQVTDFNLGGAEVRTTF